MLARIAFEVQAKLRLSASMVTRREFLGSSCAIAAAAGATTLISNARAEVSDCDPEYRALVCVALGGGADSFNMLLPADASPYQQYAARRGNLALERHEMLPLDGCDHDGRSYAVNYFMKEIQDLTNSTETFPL